ncbi:MULTISPECIES: DNA polymerase III subunit delta [unclassified Gemella]|uniref:DNA polymerase III subunit delta n=1 Tax=unclassified Gemella TaxID=2624949 RepID=UPI001C03E499|nr:MULTISPECIES: DNA polymerase III subunit delta [unclassified Gemella]MBU0278050.1 DNA polymerase III subunit delta [Gemella sp. zg-1178]QWQ38421.1 DNA polymerase III subunit delta [Gemella sp. zg-570]
MKNIYILYGENKEALLDFQNNLAEKFLGKAIDNFTYLKFNMETTNISDLLYECQSSGFFSNKKVIVAENSIFLQTKAKKIKFEHDLEALSSYLNNFNEEILLIFTVLDKIDSRKNVVKKIKEIGEIKEFKDFKEKELENYIITYLKSKKINISKHDANFLVVFSKMDFAGVKKELEKLELYCFDKKEVRKEDIENIVIRSREYDVFALTNELFKKNYIELRNVFNSLKLKGEEPILLLSLIASQLRVYYKVKMLLQENFAQKDIAAKLKIHPYRVELAVEAVYKYSLDNLMETIIICKEYDKQLKYSYMDKYLVLDLLINKLIEKLS